MRHILPAIMLVLVFLSKGMCINTDYIFKLYEKEKLLQYGIGVSSSQYSITDEDIQNIKDAMGVYEKEDEK